MLAKRSCLHLAFFFVHVSCFISDVVVFIWHCCAVRTVALSTHIFRFVSDLFSFLLLLPFFSLSLFLFTNAKLTCVFFLFYSIDCCCCSYCWLHQPRNSHIKFSRRCLRLSAIDSLFSFPFSSDFYWFLRYFIRCAFIFASAPFHAPCSILHAPCSVSVWLLMVKLNQFELNFSSQ